MKAKVEWDLEGITYDEPKPRNKRVRPKGRCPLSDFNSDCSDDNYPYPSNAYLTAQSPKNSRSFWKIQVGRGESSRLTPKMSVAPDLKVLLKRPNLGSM